MILVSLRILKFNFNKGYIKIDDLNDSIQQLLLPIVFITDDIRLLTILQQIFEYLFTASDQKVHFQVLYTLNLTLKNKLEE